MISEPEQTESLDESLRKFGEIEEVSSVDRMLSKEEFYEMYFRETQNSDKSGRFIVQMPTKVEELGALGYSRTLAEKRLQQTED